jgi:hypothetical protein
MHLPSRAQHVGLLLILAALALLAVARSFFSL